MSLSFTYFSKLVYYPFIILFNNVIIDLNQEELMKQNELAILIGFDQDSEERLIKIQNHIYDNDFGGTQSKSYPYHILAKTISYEYRDTLIKLLLKINKQHKAFPLFIDKPIITDDRSGLALHCQFVQDLSELSDQLSTQINKAEIILLTDTSNVIEQAYQLLLPTFEPLTITVSKLHLYNIDVSQHLLTVELKNE